MAIFWLLLRVFLVLSLLGWGQFVFALDYYWYVSNNASIKSSTPLGTCNLFRPSLSYGSGGPSSLDFYLPTYAYCSWRDDEGVLRGFFVNRGGDGCTPPKVLGPETNSCKDPEPDECEATAGHKIKHEYAYSQHDADGNPTPDPPAVCKDGCQYTNDFGTFHRRRDAENPDTFLGSFTYSGSGVACTSSTGDPSFLISRRLSRPRRMSLSMIKVITAQTGLHSLMAP